MIAIGAGTSEDYRSMDMRGVLGQSIERSDSVDKAIGLPVYGGDLELRGCLHSRVVRSRHASARIRSINIQPALRVPGVKAVLTAKEIPGVNLHEHSPNLPVLAPERVRFLGQAIALVAAETREAADEACEKVMVNYEVLPSVFDPELAMALGAPSVDEGGNVVGEWKISQGDVALGFVESSVIVENTYQTPFVEHAYIEPEEGVGWLDENGVINIRIGTQTVENFRNVAEVLGLPHSRVRLRGTLLGGGFGGKEDPFLEVYLGLLVWKTRRPVRLAYTREESILVTNKKHPFIIQCKTGADRNGRLTALEAKLIADAGAYRYLSPIISLGAAMTITGPYRFPHVKVDAHAVLTNNIYASAMRGVGATQTAIAYESQMDEIACRLEMDPLEFRKRNFLKPGDVLPFGQIIRGDVCLAETAERALFALGPRKEGREPVRIGRGISCNWTGYGRPGLFSRGGIELQSDGSVVVKTSAPDLGSGQSSTFSQIVAHVLGLSMESVAIHIGDSALTPLAGRTAGSYQTYMAGTALMEAAQEAREAILDTASEILETDPTDLELAEGTIVVRSAADRSVSLVRVVRAMEKAGLPLSYSSVFKSATNEFEGPPRCAEMSWLDFTFGTHAIEVAVDEETGEVTVLNMAACHDVGRALNPQSVEGQFEGGGVMGLGYGMMEELVVEKGIPRNVTFHDYLIPTSLDVPDIKSMIIESGSGIGPFGAKGIGEPPCNTSAPAILNAVRDAVGVRITSIPVTPERVLLALRKKKEKGGAGSTASRSGFLRKS